jgi:hypothetical protein
MDLYPEIAIALGEIKEGFLSRVVAGVMSWSYRRTARIVALDSDMASRLREHQVQAEIMRPWVTGDARPAIDSGRDARVTTWLYSGNLGRAHEWRTLLDAQAILEAEHAGIRLIFQGGGPSWTAAREQSDALGLKLVEWRPYAPESELESSLLQSDCLMVTQKAEVCGMLWPSKLALMLALPRPILFVGPVEGDIGRSLRVLPHAGVFAPGDARGVASWLVQLKDQGLVVRSENVVDAADHRAACLANWVAMVEACSG